MRRFQPTYCAVALALTLATPVFAADAFYTSLLKSGGETYRAKRFAEAADQLRVACFGLLDEPILLSEALARLAVAQHAAGRAADVDATLTRFVEVEQRFRAYSRVNLPAEVRTELEALIAGRVSSDVLAAIPSLASMADTPEKRLARMSPAEREREYQLLAEREPQSKAWPSQLMQASAARGDHKAVVRWASRVLEIDPQDMEARASRGHALTARRSHDEAIADLTALPASRLESDPQLLGDLLVGLVAVKNDAQALTVAASLSEDIRARPDVAKALKRLEDRKPPPEETPAPAPEPTPSPTPRPAAEIVAEARKLREAGQKDTAKALLAQEVARAPESRDLRKELLETAYLSKDWATGAAQLKSLEPFVDGEEPWMFYGAVAAFETGSTDVARGLLRRARPKIAQNAFVEFYTRKILGTN